MRVDAIERVRGAIDQALDVALRVPCPECGALVDDVCTAQDAPLLWPHLSRLVAAESDDLRVRWSA
jgi:hypothetical protein